MAKANLSLKASLATMQRLGDLNRKYLDQLKLESLEKAGKEPTTGWENFEGRNGYDPNFLEGWTIPLPVGLGNRASDMRELRRGGKGVELKYQNFSAIVSASRRLPMVTACNISGGESVKGIKRLDVWSYDGRLDKEDQWGDAIYDNNILDRGHMVRKEDPIWGDNAKIANVDTFHFTNSCPQIAGINQRTWLGLEKYILDNARADGMMVSVFTGPYFRTDDLVYKNAQIPSAFWKVVAIVTEDGRPSATAYKVSQEKELSNLEFVYGSYKTFQISVASVMEDTEIDFSSLLDYDGFTQLEKDTTGRFNSKLESLSDIRI